MMKDVFQVYSDREILTSPVQILPWSNSDITQVAYSTKLNLHFRSMNDDILKTSSFVCWDDGTYFTYLEEDWKKKIRPSYFLCGRQDSKIKIFSLTESLLSLLPTGLFPPNLYLQSKKPNPLMGSQHDSIELVVGPTNPFPTNTNIFQQFDEYSRISYFQNSLDVLRIFEPGYQPLLEAFTRIIRSYQLDQLLR